jgi:CBS domain-containing membrane protein
MPQGIPKTVGELMTRKVVTISPTDTIAQIEEGMQRFRFRHMPVVEDGKLVGLVTHRDLLHALSTTLSPVQEQRNAIIRAQPASRIMQKELVTVPADEPLLSAANSLWDKKLGCLLVTDADNVLLGILTEADFVRVVIKHIMGGETPPPPSTRL